MIGDPYLFAAEEFLDNIRSFFRESGPKNPGSLLEIKYPVTLKEADCMVDGSDKQPIESGAQGDQPRHPAIDGGALLRSLRLARRYDRRPDNRRSGYGTQ